MEQTSGVVVDVGHGVATCCVVWEGEERPGATSTGPLTCSAPVVAQMVHSLVLQCSEDVRSVVREKVVVTGKLYIVDPFNTASPLRYCVEQHLMLHSTGIQSVWL